MHVKDNILFVTFKKGAENDLQSCLGLVKKVIVLSDFFKKMLEKKRTPGKKTGTTRRIRTGIQGLVDKTNTSEEMINSLIGFIRKGQIEKIKVFINDNEFTVNPKTDFEKLLVNLLLKKTVVQI